MTKSNITSGRNTKVKNLVLTGMFTAVICVLSQISIPTQPIPFTLALFAIFLTGALLPPRAAFLSVFVYLLLGAFGIPIFAGFKGGIHVLTGMTGGYLMAYPLMSFLTSFLANHFKKWKLLPLALGMVLSLILCYFIGTLWFAFISDTSFYYALTLCVFPFILFDLLKIILALSTSVVIKKVLYKSVLND
jgi:biotin transport system substrate-specific component